MSYEYPTEEQLEKIKNWNAIADTPGLIDFFLSLWWIPERGCRLYKSKSRFFREPVMKLQLHTWGWSGNESIIAALKENAFWSLFWDKSLRGGHHWFEIESKRWVDLKKAIETAKAIGG